MPPNWAEENLAVIRTLMERAGLYRRALAPVMLAVGIIGIAAGALGVWINISAVWGVGQYWVAVALIAVAVASLLVRRQALKAQEPFWTMPAKKVCVALAPPFLLGGVLGLFDIHYDYLGSNLVEIWLGLYGCGLCAAGMYLTRGVRLLGWLFVLSALVTTAVQHPWGIMRINPMGREGFVLALSFNNDWVFVLDPNWVMGATFGGYHVIAGIYLYFTEKKEPLA